MIADQNGRSVRVRGPALPGRVRLVVDGLKGQPAFEREAAARLSALPGIHDVRANALTGTVLLVYEPSRWTSEAILEASGEALGLQADAPAAESTGNGGQGAIAIRSLPLPGRVRLAVPGLRRAPERERPLEQRLARLTGVQVARASAWTGNVLVLYEPDLCSIEQILAACSELTDQWLAERPATRPPSRLRLFRPRAERPVVTESLPPGAPPDDVAVAWHGCGVDMVAQELGADLERGLSTSEAEQRLQSQGANRLPEPEQPSLLRLVADQFLNAPTALLGAGAAVSVATGGLVEAGLIALVLGMNGAVGAATERTGHRAIAALRASAAIQARVRRDGQDLMLDAEALVPGDLIQLLPGDPVPADARVVATHRLMVEESALTGESRAVEKITAAVEERLPLADRRSMVHRGTTIVGGRGTAVVAETGPRTAIGRLHMLAAGAEAPPTPLERDLDRLGRWLATGATAICAGVFGLGWMRGVPLLHSLEVAVSLGVAAIPEGLTALATSVLALASGRMRRRGTLIRSLGAAEALGSVTVVCADKTGTLTENRMAARELHVGGRTLRIGGGALDASGPFEHDGERIPSDDALLRDALLVGALCSDAELEPGPGGQLVVDGSATEGALLIAAAKAGLNPSDRRAQHPRLDVRDRADGRRHMVTVHQLDGGPRAMMKGSPEEVLQLCAAVRHAEGDVPLDRETRAALGQINASMAGRAMRVLALAQRELAEGYDPDDLGRGYTFLGLIGLVDPIRASVPDAVRALHRAGIRTVMITGDQALTATAVARELGLSRRGSLRVLEAGDLSSLGPGALSGLVRDVGIFARVPPEMKLEVVRALQANGDVVAMTGDGVNDGPALRAADVGVAMGERGTELARELADVVLSTDDFTLMVNAVEEGRLVRANVRRVLHYMLSTNASEVWAVAGSVALGLPSPLTPLQLLWLNLVTDLAPGLGLAVEPREPDLMQQPPRDPQEPIVPGPLFRRVLLESALIALGALAAYGVGIARYGQGPAAQTMAFASLMSAQLLHVPLARAGEGPATLGGRPKNRALVVGTTLSAALQLVALFVPPVRTVLGGAALSLGQLGISALAAALPIVLIELQRRLRHSIQGRKNTVDVQNQLGRATPGMRAVPA